MLAAAVAVRERLLKMTNTLPSDANFAENSREREIAYIKRSCSRWIEVIEVTRSRLGDISKLSCLDIGTSSFTFLLKDYFHKVSTMDLTDAWKERCEAGGIDFHKGGLHADIDISGNEKYDCVFFLDVIEHIHANPIDILKRIQALLKPGGMLVDSTPNFACLGNRVAMLFNRPLKFLDYPPFGLGTISTGFGHDRLFMPSEIYQSSVDSGLEDVEVIYQKHRDDTAHARLSFGRRIILKGPAIVKRLVPSLRDGMIILGRKPRSP